MPAIGTLAHSAATYVIKTPQRLADWYHSLSRSYRTFVWCWAALHVVVGVGFWWITPSAIFAKIADGAEAVRDMKYGWLLLISIMIITSVPPLPGFGTSITLAGFAFGPWRGWLIASTGVLLGAMTSFLICRRFIHFFAPWLAKASAFRALSGVVRAKGLPLIILIRFGPFPFPYSNCFFAAVDTVSLKVFMLAVLSTIPKLWIDIWLASRMYLLADPESRNEMDGFAKWVNSLSIAVGMVLGMISSGYLYKITMKQARELAIEEGVDLDHNLLDDIEAHPYRDSDEESVSDASSDELDLRERDEEGEGRAKGRAGRGDAWDAEGQGGFLIDLGGYENRTEEGNGLELGASRRGWERTETTANGRS